jgi:hypothetical protein
MVVSKRLESGAGVNYALEKHNKSKEHIAFACKFVLFGKQNIATVIDPTATAIPR